MSLSALVLAGGSGTRFWPASRRDRPKQFLALDGDRSMLQATVARLAPLVPPERVWSTTAETGNLGSASLPVAWASHPSPPTGPVIWTAVGAGLTWGAALLGH